MDEVEFNLERLNLERQIAFEELKGIKEDVKHDLSPYRWLSTGLTYVRRYGFLYLVRKIFR